MHALLEKFNAIPGVLGSLACGPEGQLIASAFPPGFDEGALVDVAKTLAESMAGLATIAGGVHTFDLRSADARIVARPVAGATLLFLCAPSMSLQPLEISASVAAPRLEKLVAQRSGAPAPGVPEPAAAAGKLHALVQQIDAIVRRKKLDRFEARGEIGLKAGFGLGSIGADTPDDPDKLSRLMAAASEVLGEPVGGSGRSGG